MKKLFCLLVLSTYCLSACHQILTTDDKQALMPSDKYHESNNRPLEQDDKEVATTSKGFAFHTKSTRNTNYSPPHEQVFSRTNYLHNKKFIIKALEKESIQIINEGHRITILIPTDLYYVFDTERLNDLRYPVLDMVVELIHCFDEKDIFVSAFTDDVGSNAHKRALSQNRAKSMMAFLWARGISRKNLHAAGYGDKFSIGNNQLIRGSAFNRRVEIQWST